MLAPPASIFLTGAGGFVGAAVLRELLRRGSAVHALVNRQPPRSSDPRVQSFPGGLFDPQAVDQAMQRCTGAIHLVGIIAEQPGKGVTFQQIHVEGTRRVLDAARRHGVQRFIQMSALGVRPDAVSRYHQTKWQAEEDVRASGLDWTILRPSMIHGPGGEFMQMEAAWARGRRAPFLFMPHFGRGVLGATPGGRIQPVHVEDVARAFVDCLANRSTIHQTYELAGPDVMTWPQMHATVSRILRGKPKRSLGIPAWYARTLTRIVPRALLPFNRDQVIMSQEDNTADLTPFIRDFGWTPRPFEPSLRDYAGQI